MLAEINFGIIWKFIRKYRWKPKKIKEKKVTICNKNEN